jgi:hypothetical protein
MSLFNFNHDGSLVCAAVPYDRRRSPDRFYSVDATPNPLGMAPTDRFTIPIRDGVCCCIPASSPCLCGNAACTQDRLAYVDCDFEGGNKLYIWGPGVGVLHKYKLNEHRRSTVSLDWVPIALATADWRQELVIVFKHRALFDDRRMVYTWKIGSDIRLPERAFGANNTYTYAAPLRKLGIDTSFLGDTTRPCIAAGGGKLFLAGEVELRGYDW